MGATAIHEGATTTTKTVIIPSGGNISAVLDLEGSQLIGIMMSAAWDAASLTFQAAAASDGTTGNMYDDLGTEVTVAASAGLAIGVSNAMISIASFRYIKIRSGTAAVPVNQTADRTLTLVLKR